MPAGTSVQVASKGGWVDVATTLPPPQVLGIPSAEVTPSTKSTFATVPGSWTSALREIVAGAVNVCPPEGFCSVSGKGATRDPLPDPPPPPPPPQAGSRTASAAPRIRNPLVFMRAVSCADEPSEG